METKNHRDTMFFIKKLGRPVFTSHELTAISAKSASTVTQSLNRLAKQGLLIKIYRGVWAETGTQRLTSFEVIPYLFARQRVYVSFISALHLHGIIEQIPQVVTLASTAHTCTIRTKVGVFSAHQIAPSFFTGFDWYKGDGSFLIADPEKALIDSLYLSSRKKKQFGYFPELYFPATFSFKKAEEWAKRIPEKKIGRYVLKKLDALARVWKKGKSE
jgi:predicted transcriptional regulator of viral defense system